MRDPWVEKDEHGSVVMATVSTVWRLITMILIASSHDPMTYQYGDTVHTFIERKNYRGEFLPGYAKTTLVDPLGGGGDKGLAVPNLSHIDHIVGNQPDGEMVPVCEL